MKRLWTALARLAAWLPHAKAVGLIGRTGALTEAQVPGAWPGGGAMQPLAWNLGQ